MTAFLKELLRRDPFLKRATGASTTSYKMNDDGSFRVTVQWEDRNGSPVEYSRLFTPESTYKRISAGVPIRPLKKPCHVVDDIILAVVQKRKYG